MTKESTMSRALELAAIQAIFHRQYSTDRATHFVTKATGVTPQVAERALREVMLSYKTQK
jgi:hypothetical protein